MSAITFEKFSALAMSNISSILLAFFSIYYPVTIYILPFENVSISSYLHSLVLLSDSVIGLSRAFFISVTLFLISSISVWFFLNFFFYLPAYISHMLFYVFTYFIKGFSILIMVILSVLSDNLNMLVIWFMLYLGSAACYVSSEFLPFIMPCNFVESQKWCIR